MTRTTVATVDQEEEFERIQKERDQLNRECTRILESERKIGEELKTKK